jgi:hypothetical protein
MYNPDNYETSKSNVKVVPIYNDPKPARIA